MNASAAPDEAHSAKALSTTRDRSPQLRKVRKAGQTRTPVPLQHSPASARSTWCSPATLIHQAVLLLTAYLALGYRAGAGARDMMQAPLQTALAGLTGQTRQSPVILDDAKQAVLARFAQYIPEDSACRGKVVAELSFDAAAIQNFAIRSGYFQPANGRKPARLALSPYQNSDEARQIAMHEFCHCFTHPLFTSSGDLNPHRAMLTEGLTEHFSYQIAGAHARQFSQYAAMKLTNGKTLPQAIEEVQARVGVETLMRAYFSGDNVAIEAVWAAARNIFPKKSSSQVWKVIANITDPIRRQAMGECFVAAAILLEGCLPTSAVGQVNGVLPVRKLGDITPEQTVRLKAAGVQAREQLGQRFDAVFYPNNGIEQHRSMLQLDQYLSQHWPLVFSPSGA